jgi:fluoride exporter
VKNLFWVGLGGALGAMARYGMGNGLSNWNPHSSFSAGTLLANLSGCLLMGALVEVIGQMNQPQKDILSAFVLAGFLGSLTTFSTFILEAFKLGQSGNLRITLAHLGGHLGVGFFGLWLGYNLSQRFTS